MTQMPLCNCNFSSIQSYMEMAGAQVKTGIFIPLNIARRVSPSIHQNHSACSQPVGGPDVSVTQICFVGQRFCALISRHWMGWSKRVRSRKKQRALVSTGYVFTTAFLVALVQEVTIIRYWARLTSGRIPRVFTRFSTSHQRMIGFTSWLSAEKLRTPSSRDVTGRFRPNVCLRTSALMVCSGSAASLGYTGIE